MNKIKQINEKVAPRDKTELYERDFKRIKDMKKNRKYKKITVLKKDQAFKTKSNTTPTQK